MRGIVLALTLVATAVAAQDRATVQVTTRAASGSTLTLTLASGLTITIPATDLVYVRDDWPHWLDVDRDCQDARQEVLIAESEIQPTLDAAGCRVLAGRWTDRFSGEIVTDPARAEIDHLVPLAYAFRTGGWAWGPDQRAAFANDLSDPDHLSVLSASTNRSKGSRGPQAWQPPQRGARCWYARAWLAIAGRWGLTVAPVDHDALTAMLGHCVN